MAKIRFTRLVPRLPTANLAATIGFYTSMLGFRLGAFWPEDEPTFAILHRDDISIQFNSARKPASKETTICIDVSDAAKLHQKLKKLHRIEWGPEVYWYGRREFAIRDPNGYLIIFSEQTDEPATCKDG